MRHGSLFSGIGGFDYAAQLMGWENVFHCEWNEFGQRVLKYYWPNAISYHDITKTDFTIHRGRIDVLTGGFPCQPYSLAGKRLGKDDDRHLWPQMLRAIREIQPTWVVGENVFGLINWNEGLVFDEVQADLEAEGYEVQPYVLPACAVNAPHRRDRVWFVAHSISNRHNRNKPTKRGNLEREQSANTQQARNKWTSETFGFSTKQTPSNPDSDGHELRGLGEDRPTKATSETNEQERERLWDNDRGISEQGNATDTDGTGREKQHFATKSTGENNTNRNVMHADSTSEQGEHISKEGQGELDRPNSRNGINYFQNFPTQSPICNGDDGLSACTHTTSISEERNAMDRNLVIKKCLEEGRLKADVTTGKIYSLKQRGKEGQQIELMGSDCNGYIVHGIRYNGFKIQLRAHQIVWISANGLYDKSCLMIDHINRNKKDNRLENLRLVDAKGNRENATPYAGKLTEEQKDMMVWFHKEDGIPIRELAEDFGISKSRVHQIIQEHSGIYGITFSKWRNESIKAGGNAVVPQVVLQIFKAIEQYSKINP
jgi:DNA (cytosine-5)-methyltransferase 1